MKNGIFISYRRDDSPGQSGRVYDWLTRRFKKTHIFIDVDNISPGDNFETEVTRAIDDCNTMLVIIGKNWLRSSAAGNAANLSGTKDWVEFEVVTAIKKDIRIIPVLLEDTNMPPVHYLPPDMQPLVLKNALSVRHLSFHSDMETLVTELRKKHSIKNNAFNTADALSKSFIVLLILLLLYMIISSIISEKTKKREAEKELIDKEIIEMAAYDISSSDATETARPLNFNNFYFIPNTFLLKRMHDTANRYIQDGWKYNRSEKKAFESLFYYIRSDSSLSKFDSIDYFFVSRFNVDNLLWKTVMKTEAPKRLRPCNGCPLPQIDWPLIEEFVEAFNKKTGKTYKVLSPIQAEYIDSLKRYYSKVSVLSLEIGGDQFGVLGSVKPLKIYSKKLNYQNKIIVDLGFRLCTDTKLSLRNSYGDITGKIDQMRKLFILR